VSRKWEKGRGTSVFVESFFDPNWENLKGYIGILKVGENLDGESNWEIHIIYIYIMSPSSLNRPSCGDICSVYLWDV
jgi:hypothetical protein